MKYLFLIMATILCWSSPSRADLSLDPGDALTEQHILELAGLKADAGDDRRRIWQFHAPDLPMTNTASSTVSIDLASVDYQEATGQLLARLDAKLETGEASRLQVRARATYERLIPVAGRELPVGSIITEADLDWIWLSETRIRPEHATDLDQLVGYEVRRSLREGRPVQTNMVQEAQIIKRGELVEVTYDQNGLFLSMVAEAVENGTHGQLVRLRNLDSGQRLVARANGWQRAIIDGGVR